MTLQEITTLKEKLQRLDKDISITRSLIQLSIAEAHFADTEYYKEMYNKQVSECFIKLKDLRKIKIELEKEYYKKN